MGDRDRDDGGSIIVADVVYKATESNLLSIAAFLLLWLIVFPGVFFFLTKGNRNVDWSRNR